MKRPLRTVLAAIVFAGAVLFAAGAPPAAASAAGDAQAAPGVTVDFAGTVALSNCSGSLIKLPTSTSTDPALVMTNGHCLSGDFLDPDEVVTDESSSRAFTLLNSSGRGVGTLRATKVAYATMTDTDVALYQLTQSYARIQSDYGIAPLPLSGDHPVRGTAIKVVSGYWKTIYSCEIDGFVRELREGDWVWKDSVRYTPACETIGGTSGSPVIDTATGQVVAINNTGNEDGERCTVNNPCEVQPNGAVTIREGINYAEQTYGITKCFTTGNTLDLTLPGCALPKP
jgi:V8-like Glu-specific endopeptidase